MKSTNDVKTFYRSAKIDTNPEADNAVLADALQAGGLTTKKRAARAEPNVWRAIMKSRTTQLTAAGLVMVAAIIVVSQFNGTTVAAVEFSEITQAMQEVPWMHVSAVTKGPNVTGMIELWIGFEAKVQGDKDPDGKVSFCRFKEREIAQYDPESNTITLSHAQEGAFSPRMTSPALMLEGMQKMLTEHGAQIVARKGAYQGQKVQVQEISLTAPDQGMTHYSVTLYVDLQSNLLHGYESTATDVNGTVVAHAETTCDYPTTGPRDIYDLGVPADAQVIDNRPEVSFQTFQEEYGRTRTDATDDYIAIVAHRNPRMGGIVTMIDVDFKSGRKQRQERHAVFHRGESLDELWPTYKEQLGETFASLLAWSRRHYDDPQAEISIHLYDGEYYCSASRDGESDWNLREKDYTPGYNPGPLGSLGDLAWPTLILTAQIIDDDYAQRHGLICIESLGQGQVSPDGWPSLPSRWLKYLDPSRDYLCVRQLIEWRPDADWQEDKDWLADVDPEKMRQGSITATEIIEAVQAPNGHWYPETIVEKSTGRRADYHDAPLETRLIKQVYLDVSPEFPEHILDVKELPGQ